MNEAAAFYEKILCLKVIERSEQIIGYETGSFRFFADVILIILLLQPDASQATAFALCFILLILYFESRTYLKYLQCLIIAFIASLSWLRPDPLSPVPYVEGVMVIAFNHGIVFITAAIVSFLLPSIFLIWYGTSK